jgi:hypothetical protein
MPERSPEADIELSRVSVAENPGAVFLMDLPCVGMMVSLLLELGRDLPNPLRYEGFLLGSDGAVAAIWQNHPAFPQIAGRDGLAPDCQHSHHLSY